MKARLASFAQRNRAALALLLAIGACAPHSESESASLLGEANEGYADAGQADGEYEPSGASEDPSVDLARVDQGLAAAPSRPIVIPWFANCTNNQVARYWLEVLPRGDVPATRWIVDLKHGAGSWSTIYDGTVLPSPIVALTVGSSATVRARACNGRTCSAYETTKIKGACAQKSGEGADKKLPKVPGPKLPIKPF